MVGAHDRRLKMEDRMPGGDAEYMTQAEVCALIRVSPRTLVAWRQHRTGPPPIDVSTPGARKPTWRYARADVLAWLRERRVTT